MDLRPYKPGDRDACLALFDSNAPRYFDPAERRGFESFLESPGCPYFVMEHDGVLAGCGGYLISPAGDSARLVWGMVRGDVHKLGLGRFLLMFRLREIGKARPVQTVHVATSQHATPFFEKQGFRVLEIVANGHGPGLDRVEMVKKLTVCA